MPPMPQFKIAKEKPPARRPAADQEAEQQDFDALLNKLTAPDKPVKERQGRPRIDPGHRRRQR